MATAPKAPRVIQREELRDIEAFLKQVDELLGDIPVYIDHAEITISAATISGPGDELGQVVIDTDDQEEVTVTFHPYAH